MYTFRFHSAGYPCGVVSLMVLVIALCLIMFIIINLYTSNVYFQIPFSRLPLWCCQSYGTGNSPLSDHVYYNKLIH